jgi:nucleotide-binding universal stress UspA family protein
MNSESLSYLRRNNLDSQFIDRHLMDIRDELEKSYPIKVLAFKREGKLNETIASVSKEVFADLVLLGTHGMTGLQVITGSHAMKVIREVDVPVLVIQKRTFGMGYRKIVFPVSVSSDYNVKIDWTLFIANTFKAEVLLIVMKPADDKLQHGLDGLLTRIESVFAAHHIPYTLQTAQRSKDFPEQINQFAVEQNADLIMIKVDDDEFEPSFILGAVEEKMIFNSSQIPVFCAQKKTND